MYLVEQLARNHVLDKFHKNLKTYWENVRKNADPMPKIISLGGGLQSTLMVIMAANGDLDVEMAVMSDTGSEMPHTYDYFYNVLLPYCRARGFRLEVLLPSGEFVRRKKLHLWYYERKSIPYRVSRSCTDKWKITPIARFLKEEYPDGCYSLLGFTTDEIHRATRNKGSSKNPTLYPLLDLDLAREDLYPIYEKYGLPAAEKSGCFLCPFQNKASWINLYKSHNDLYNLSVEMDHRNIIYTDNAGSVFYGLTGRKRTLDEQMKTWKEYGDLADVDDEMFCNTSCFT